MVAAPETVVQPIRIDLGAGKNPKQGFIGIDLIDFGNGNLVCDLSRKEWVITSSRQSYGVWCDETEPELGWMLPDNSVEEAHCSHFLEHLTNMQGRFERVHFFNELYRVLMPEKGCLITIPHWASQRYYGDPTHCEPFSEFGWQYLNKAWRLLNAPHTDIQYSPNGYTCDFECTWGYALHPSMTVRHSDYQQHAMQWWLEARQDMICTAKARK